MTTNPDLIPPRRLKPNRRRRTASLPKALALAALGVIIPALVAIILNH